MSSSESDIEMKKHSVPKKSSKKPPSSPSEGMLKHQDPKKVTTKQMIHEAIADMTGNSRKGVSLHAIKKYLVDKYAVDVDRIGFLIRKTLKTGLEDGTILQTKGVGVSGSFRMSAKKKVKVAKAKTAKKPKEKKEKSEKNEGKMVKIAADETKAKKTEKKTTKSVDKKEKSTKAVKTLKKGAEKTKKPSKTKDTKTEEGKKSKKVIEKATPAKKKAAMMKRKSIGSIIKPPKMKPKARD